MSQPHGAPVHCRHTQHTSKGSELTKLGSSTFLLILSEHWNQMAFLKKSLFN